MLQVSLDVDVQVNTKTEEIGIHSMAISTSTQIFDVSIIRLVYWYQIIKYYYLNHTSRFSLLHKSFKHGVILVSCKRFFYL